MRLNLQTDYAFRLLMHLAANTQRLVTIAEVADRFRISRTHLMKVAYLLGKEGLIQTVRGRAGGMRLAFAPDAIGLGDVVRRLEGDMPLVGCMAGEPGFCIISSACRLKGVFHEALRAFLDVLDRYTLADLTANPKVLALLRERAA